MSCSPFSWLTPHPLSSPPTSQPPRGLSHAARLCRISPAPRLLPRASSRVPPSKRSCRPPSLAAPRVLACRSAARAPTHTYCDAAYSVLLHHVFLQRPVHPSPLRIQRSPVRLHRRAACRFALTHGTRKPHLSHVSVMACSALSAAVLYGDRAVRAFGIHGRCRALASIHLAIAPGSRSLYFVRPWCCGLRAISIF